MKFSLPLPSVNRQLSKTLSGVEGSTVNGKVKHGFTLIELLVVIGILTILLAITLVAVNPGRQFKQSNDTQRKSDINAVLNAIHQYSADNKGLLPGSPTIDTTLRSICKTGGTVTCPVGAATDLCGNLAPTYIAELPRDPLTTVGILDPASSSGPCASTTLGYNSGYKVQLSSTGSRISVFATPEIQPPTTLSVTR